MFTDYLGNPIKPGDIIVYPTAQGSSSADMNMARVEAIDPIVEDRAAGPGLYCFESMLRKKHSSVRPPRRATDDPHDDGINWAKAFRLKIKKLREGRTDYGHYSWENVDRTFTITNVDRVVVVNDLTVIR